MSVEAAEGPVGQRVATRRRGEVLERAIFEATMVELDQVGYGRLTMEGVAARARTGKAALYRRWPCKSDLVVDALSHLLPSPDDLPDHGDVRADLLDTLGRIQATINSPTGCVIRALVADAERDEAFATVVHERVLLPRKRMLIALLRRGADRGQVRPEAATPLVAEIGPSMLVQRYLTLGPPVPDEYVLSVVDSVIMPLLVRREGPAPAGRPSP